MKHLLFSLVSLFAFSCATTIKNFDSYNKSPLLQSEFMPKGNALEKKLPSAVIFDFQAESYNAKRIGASTMATDYLINLLVSGKLAEVQDRKNLTKLQEEIRLSETSGRGGASSIKAVDYAVDGTISNVTFSSEFLGAYYDNEGKMIQPDRFNYVSSVTGSIKIYELPSLKVVDTISFSGSAKKTEEVKASGGFKIGKLQSFGKVQAKEFDENLAKEAVRNGLAKSTNAFKNHFAKTGYIMEKRIFEDKSIFLINLGSSDGIKQEDKLQIMQKYSELNPLTGKEEASTRNIGYGVVADRTEDGRTWIVVKDKTTASKIRLGDIVKVQY